MEKKSKKKDKQRAAAFVNWEVTTKTGIVVKSDRGFPIFQNPEYPNAKEDLLVALKAYKREAYFKMRYRSLSN
jgi:hypothetical protein